MNTGKVAIGYCHPGEVAGLFNESLVLLLMHDYRAKRRILNGGDVISLTSGPRIASARNAIVKAFLDHPNGAEWLWMVDADMSFAPDALDRLVRVAEVEGHKILGGLCFGGGRSGVVFPTLYRLEEPDAEGRVVHVVEQYPPASVVKVDATGAACLLIHRSVLAAMLDRFGTTNGVPNPAPWFAETFYAGREFGEDWTFCLRAAQAGFDIHVYTGVKLGHVKAHLLDEEAFAAYQVKRERLGGEQHVAADFRRRAFNTDDGRR